MTAVFVHGVPETPAVWSGLLAALGRPDAVALWLPGFDGVRPEGFGATMDEYAAWLVAQLEQLGEPVDLVGHDWGGGFVVRVVSTRPDLIRSWVTDAAGIGDVEFEWHDFAKIWQTPQAGEDFWNQQLAASTEERAGVFTMFGVPDEPEQSTFVSWRSRLLRSPRNIAERCASWWSCDRLRSARRGRRVLHRRL